MSDLGYWVCMDYAPVSYFERFCDAANNLDVKRFRDLGRPVHWSINEAAETGTYAKPEES